MDVIEPQLAQFLDRFTEQGILVVHGTLSEESGIPRMDMEFSGAGPLAWGAFLQAAVSLKAKFVTAEIGRLEQTELDEAIAVAQDAADDEVESQRAVLVELERCRSRVGHVASISLGFISSDPAVRFSVDWYSPWNEHVYGTTEMLEGLVDGTQDRYELTEAQVTALAKQLASDPRFQKATKADARLFVARKLFDSKTEEYGSQLDDIISEASNIYELEIKTAQEDVLRNKAMTMIRMGRSRASTATELGLTPHKLGKLLEERPMG